MLHIVQIIIQIDLAFQMKVKFKKYNLGYFNKSISTVLNIHSIRNCHLKSFFLDAYYTKSNRINIFQLFIFLCVCVVYVVCPSDSSLHIYPSFTQRTKKNNPKILSESLIKRKCHGQAKKKYTEKHILGKIKSAD